MALSERLALLITANVDSAVKGFQKVGKEAERSLGKAEDKLERTGTSMTRIGVGATALGLVGAAGLVKLGSAASDLNEVTSQSEQIFGSAQGKIEDFAEGAAKSIGQSERAAREGANTFGLFFTNAGKSADEAASMSIELSKLASDMASFKNTSPEEAVEALGAALRGESEPIRRYGVMLDDATLKQRALDMGLVSTTTGTLPPAIKMQAAYAEILAQTSTIQGDFARTSDGAANQQRIFAAEMENLKANIGAGVLPVMTNLVTVASDVAGAFGRLDEGTQGAVGSIATYASGGLIAVGVTSSIIGQLIKAKTNFGAARTAFDNAAVSLYDFAGSAKAAKAAQVGLIGAAVVGGFMLVDEAMGRWSESMEDVEGNLDEVTSRLRVLANVGSNSGIDIKGLAEDFDLLGTTLEDHQSNWKKFTGLFTSADTGDQLEFQASLEAAAEDIDKFDKGLANMVAGGSVKEARAAFQGMKADLLAAGVPIDKIISGFSDYNAALGTHMRNVRANSAAEVDGAAAADIHARALSPAGEAAKRAGEEFRGLRVASEEASTAGGAFATSIDTLAYNMGVVEAELSELNTEIDTYLGKTFGVQDATDEFQGSINGLKAAVTAAGTEFTGTSDKAIEFRNSQEEVVSSAAGVITAMAEQGASADEVKKRQGDLADQYYLTAIAAGVPKGVAELYAAAIRDIPSSAYTSYTFDAGDAEAAIDRLQRKVNGLNSSMSGRAQAAFVQANMRAEGGPVTRGQPYIVGEKQPELFVPSQNGTILPSVPRQGGRTLHIGQLVVNGGGDPQVTADAVIDAIQRRERALAGATASVE